MYEPVPCTEIMMIEIVVCCHLWQVVSMIIPAYVALILLPTVIIFIPPSDIQLTLVFNQYIIVYIAPRYILWLLLIIYIIAFQQTLASNCCNGETITLNVLLGIPFTS